MKCWKIIGRLHVGMKRKKRACIMVTFLWLLLTFVATWTAPKSITVGEIVQKYYRRTSQRICGTTSEFGKFCRSPCWNGAKYQEPQFLLKPQCEDFYDSTVLIYSYSSLHNTKERFILREKYKKEFTNTAINPKLVFVVGAANSSSLRKDFIQTEAFQANDIIQIDILDSYFNLGFKAIGIFKWIKECGPKMPELIVKIDDDAPEIFSKVKNVVLSLIVEDHRLRNEIMCGITLHNAQAHEHKLKKSWETSPKQYFSPVFPSFCRGDGGMFMSQRTAHNLYEAAKDRRIFHLDDIYVTGLLRQRACIEIVESNEPFWFILNIVYKIYALIGSILDEDDIDTKELENL